jgi:hypothetical protein
LHCNPLDSQYVENARLAADMILNSSPCSGNTAKPPIALRSATNGVVQAGHPGVKAIRVPANTVEEPVPFISINLEPLILDTNREMLIPARAEATNVSAIETARYTGP